ncbi:MAG: class I SAM-dependent methyltransferase [Thermoproteota archaeon]
MNLGSVGFGLRHLSHAYSYMKDSYTFADKIHSFTGSSYDDIRSLDQEAKLFIKSLRIQIGAGPELKCRALYILIRLLKPDKIVETGVATGFTSSCILAALDKNNKGHLYSIDLPIHSPRVDADGQMDMSIIPNNELPGYIIPSLLRNRWSLTLGKSEDKLPDLLDTIGAIDMFFHDSEHSYSNMMFELNESLSHIQKEGIIASDDVNYNTAFQEFCIENSLAYDTICYLGLAKLI